MMPLVLLPGMMCDARLFAPQINALSATRPIHAGTVTEADNVSELAAEVLLSAPPQFAIAGLSMGGIVAMEVVRQAPQRVKKIALLDTNPKAEHPAVAAARAPQIARVKAGDLAKVMRDEMKPNYLAQGPRRAEILDLCMAMAEGLGAEVFVNQSRALQSRPDQQDTLRDAEIPALILCGREDTLCPVHRHELMHELMPGSQLTIIEDAGHLPTLEQPQETTAALMRWLGDE